MQPFFGLFIVLAVAIIILAASMIISSLWERKLIDSGVLPSIDKTTDGDILKLLKTGYKTWAIKRYRQLYNVSFREAKAKIEAMQSDESLTSKRL